MASADAILALVASARGERPQSLDSREAEEVLNIALALAVELCVANDRIDRLERLVAEGRGTPVETLRDLRFEGAEAQERQQAADALLTRVLRVLIDPRAPVDNRADAR